MSFLKRIQSFLVSTLFLRLVLPLTAVLAISTIGHFSASNPDGYWFSIALEAASLIFVVLYVDWVLKVHEREQQQDVHERLTSKLERLYNATHAGIRASVGSDGDFAKEMTRHEASQRHVKKLLRLRDEEGVAEMIRKQHEEGAPDDVQKEARELALEYAQNHIKPNLDDRLLELDNQEWNQLVERQKDLLKDVDQILSLFGRHLSLDQNAVIMDIQDSADAILRDYEIIPGLIGRDVESLELNGPAKEQLYVMQTTISHHVANHLHDLLDHLERLREASDFS